MLQVVAKLPAMLLLSAHAVATGGLNAGDYIQLVATVVAAIAAGAAWKAALAGRDTALATSETARQTSIGHMIEVHSDRLATLRELHSRVSWISEGGGPRASLTRGEVFAVMTGRSTGTQVVRGIEILGMITATGLELPWCRKVADCMKNMKTFGTPIRQALEELQAAMDAENRIIAGLETSLTSEHGTFVAEH